MNDTDDIDITLRPAGSTGNRASEAVVASTPPVECAPEVWLSKEAEEFIDRFAEEDTSRERGGVLLGNLLSVNGKEELRIEKAIPAKHTKAGAAHVTFTHETWQEIEEERARVAPDLRIVGWFHTHPGFGVFLSRMDQFIQQHFFNLPWQVAYVVDPVRNQRGFFRWSNGRAVPVGEYRLYSTGGVHVPATAPPAEPPAATAQPVPARPQLGYVACLALGLVAGLAIGYWVTGLTVRPPAPIVREIVRYSPGAQASKGPEPQHYRVEPGDTLWSIAQSNLGDGRRWPEIARMNRLRNPNLIRPGWYLHIPPPFNAPEVTTGER